MPEPVALSVKVPDSMSTLKSISDFASTMVNVRRGGIQLQRETQANNERIALQDFMRTPENWQTNGAVDLEKVNKAVPAIAPMTGAETIARLTTLGNAQTNARSARQKLTQDQRSLVAGPLGVLGRAGVTDPQAYQEELDSLKATNPDNPELHRLIDSYGTLIKMAPPNAIPKQAVIVSQQLLSPEAQQTSLTPTAGLTSTGGALAETVSQPAVGGNAPSVSFTGNSKPLTLPPTATTVSQTGQPVYVGRSAGGQAVPAGNPPGFEAGVGGSVKTMNEDWDATVKGGQYSSTNIANLQNIKRFAKDAQTGVGSERRTLVAGLAGLLGMDTGEMAKTSTDLLAKNSNMLALAGGDTNLAKSLAEMANPNQHMTKEAISEAANQVISIHKLAQAKMNYLRPFKAMNNPDQYSKALAEWNANADPRLLQWSEMSPKERQDMKSSMSENERAEFRRKGQRLVELGIIK